jgi:hypothetical protein
MIRLAMVTGPTKRAKVIASKGVWALHRTPKKIGGYTVTHVPTGWAATPSLPMRVAVKALRACAALPGDWSFTDAAAMTTQQKAAGDGLYQRIRTGAL